MTLIELYDPHELALVLEGQLKENFEVEALKEIPEDLSGRKNNLLIVVGKNYGDLDQYKKLKEHYLAIVVFIKDMEATQVRSLQHTDESFDAYFSIPWQKTALQFYLEDLAEFKANELKDELELSTELKGNQTKSGLLQNLFDQAPGEDLPFGEPQKAEATSTLSTDNIVIDEVEDKVEELGALEESGEGIDLLEDFEEPKESLKEQTELESVPAVDHSKTINIDSLEDFSLDLSEDDDNADIAEEDSDEDLFDLEASLNTEVGEIDLGMDIEEESVQAMEASEESLAENDEDFELDFSIQDEISEEEILGEDIPEEEGTTVIGETSDSLEEEGEEENLSLSEDAVQKLKEIDEILDQDSLSESSISKVVEAEDLNFSLDDEELDESHSQDVEPRFKEQESNEEHQEAVGATAIGSASIANEIQGFDGDLERAGAIIAELRRERDYLEKRVTELEKDKLLKDNSDLDLRAELNERRIELQIIKKRHNGEIDQLRLELNEAQQKNAVIEEKRKFLENELANTRGQVQFDLKKIKSRERELEDRIDLIRKDAEVQIRNRDSSILDLKRKIDMLEFNLDNAVQKDRKNIESRFELENKVDKVMQTLRNAIGVLEEDLDVHQAVHDLDGDNNG